MALEKPRHQPSVTQQLADPLLVRLEASNGARVDIEVFANAGYGYDVRCEVLGTKGYVAMGPRGHELVDRRDRRRPGLPARLAGAVPPAYDAEISNWVDSLADGRPTANAWDGYAATVVAEALVRALQTGHREAVSVGTPARPLSLARQALTHGDRTARLCYARQACPAPPARRAHSSRRSGTTMSSTEEPGAPTVLGIDLQLIHEVTSPQAFEGLRRRGLTVRHPERTIATADHSTPTHDRSLPILDQQASLPAGQAAANCQEFGIPLYALGSDRQGIVHVIGPELGLTQPGMTIVCGDSHTATHGAFGALAFGIGTSEVEMVLATQTLLQRPLKTYEVNVTGTLKPGVTSKDIILNLISRIGTAGGTGHVFEYRGEAIRALTMEQRMTICNMSIEGGARAGLIAPDETTFEYVKGRPHAPSG